MINKTAKAILASLILALPLASCASADEILDSLIFRAEAQNPMISAYHEKTVRAEEAVKEASAKMGPKAVIAAASLWQEDAVTANIPVMGGLSIPVISKNIYAAAVGFFQSIYSGGSLSASKQAAVLAKDAASAQEKRMVQSVANSVRISYYSLRRAQAKEKVANEALMLSENHLKKAEKLFKAGVVAKSDVLRTKVAAAEAEMNLIKTSNAVKLSLTALERAVGAEIGEDLLKKEPKASDDNEKIGTEEETESFAYENREELKAYTLLAKQAEKVAKAAKGQLLPQIVAGGLLSTADGSETDTQNEWRIAAAMYWNIYDGGAVTAKTKQAKAQARELLFMLDDMKNVIKMEVTQSRLNLRSAESRKAAALRRLAEAEEDYRIAVKRYDANVGTNLDMLDARLSLINSRTELIDTIYDIKTSKAELFFAMGK